MFVEWRYIFLGWVLYDSYNTICLDYSIMYYLRSPSVAELNARKINSIALLYLTDKDAITDDYSVHCVV